MLLKKNHIIRRLKPYFRHIYILRVQFSLRYYKILNCEFSRLSVRINKYCELLQR